MLLFTFSYKTLRKDNSLSFLLLLFQKPIALSSKFRKITFFFTAAHYNNVFNILNVSSRKFLGSFSVTSNTNSFSFFLVISFSINHFHVSHNSSHQRLCSTLQLSAYNFKYRTYAELSLLCYESRELCKSFLFKFQVLKK